MMEGKILLGPNNYCTINQKSRGRRPPFLHLLAEDVLRTIVLGEHCITTVNANGVGTPVTEKSSVEALLQL